MPGPKPILFFAPDHAVATVQELGPKGFGEAVRQSWKSFLGAVDGVVAIDERQGLGTPPMPLSKRFRAAPTPKRHHHSALNTRPSFITKRTDFSTVTSAVGSPATAIKSAALPGSSEPTSLSTPSNVAAFIVAA